MAFGFEIKGIDVAIKKLNNAANTLIQDAQDLLNEFVSNVASAAKRLAPGDEGHLRGAIAPIYVTGKNLEASVVAAVVYAAFMEFGTRKFAAVYVATLPADWQTYAATFRGQTGGGTFDEFLLAIMQWVKRKGIVAQPTQFEQSDEFSFGKLKPDRAPKKVSKQDAQDHLAYMIALKIMREGVQPHPFLYPAVIQYIPELTANFKKLLDL